MAARPAFFAAWTAAAGRLSALAGGRRARQPQARWQLGHRSIYVLPTRAGWMLALVLLVLLVAAINYQLNLGYLLTFWIAGAALLSAWAGQRNLRGLVLQMADPAPVFCGQPCAAEVQLLSPTRTRHALALAWGPPRGQRPDWAEADASDQGPTTVALRFTPTQRGRVAVPRLTLRSFYPLGVFRLWTHWQPAAQVLVYPVPEQPCPPLPDEALAGPPSPATPRAGVEAGDGVRAYQRGDPLRSIVWKKAAQAFATGSGQLVSRAGQAPQARQLWLDAAHTGLADPEARLSRLAAWVLLAHGQDSAWALRLPSGRQIATDRGDAHVQRCLEALALE